MSLHEHWFRVGESFGHPSGWTIEPRDHRDFNMGGTFAFVEPFAVVDGTGHEQDVCEGAEGAAVVAERMIAKFVEDDR